MKRFIILVILEVKIILFLLLENFVNFNCGKLCLFIMYLICFLKNLIFNFYILLLWKVVVNMFIKEI